MGKYTHMHASFIIPTRNEAPYVEACLRSIRAQQGSYEIIVVDSLSRDRTRAIARNYADTIVQEKRPGPAAARNAGAQRARGEVLVFCDADVRFRPGFLARLAQQPAFASCICSVVPYDADRSWQRAVYRVLNHVVRACAAAGIPFSTGSCIIASRRAFRAVGGFNPSLLTNEDHDLVQKLRRGGGVRYCKDIVVATSARRVRTLGLVGTLMTYAHSVAQFLLNRKSLQGYWRAKAI